MTPPDGGEGLGPGIAQAREKKMGGYKAPASCGLITTSITSAFHEACHQNKNYVPNCISLQSA